MNTSGLKVHSPHVLSLSGSLNELAYVPLSGIGIDVQMLPHSGSGHKVNYFKKEYFSGSDTFESKLVDLIDGYTRFSNLKKSFLYISFQANCYIREEEVFVALATGLNHCYKGKGLEEQELFNFLLQFLRVNEIPFSLPFLQTAFFGGMRFFYGEKEDKHFRERLPNGYKWVCMLSKKAFHPLLLEDEDLLLAKQKAVAFIHGLFYADLSKIKQGMTLRSLHAYPSNYPEYLKTFTELAEKYGAVGFNHASQSHLYYALFQNSLESSDFLGELRRRTAKHKRYLKLFESEINEEGVMVL